MKPWLRFVILVAVIGPMQMGIAHAQGGPGKPPGGGSRTPVKLSGAFTVDGLAETTSARTCNSFSNDVSSVLVMNGGNLTLNQPAITKRGDSSNEENSSFFGQNAGVLVTKNSRAEINGGSITTSGRGANGLFATGAGAFAAMTGGTITADGDAAHGVMASAGGALALTNVTIVTSRAGSAAVATDRGSGTIHVSCGNHTTHGTTSPGIYSTGEISAENATFTATASEGAVIEGRNSITLTNCVMTGAVKCGVMIYQSFSGDAEGREGTFAMAGGSLTAAQGPLFFVSNSRGNIRLQGAKLAAASGVLVNATADRWGRSGANGGHAVFTAVSETLAGNLTCDRFSSITVTLQHHTTLTGAITGAALTIDATSRWNVTADSVVTSLTLAGGISSEVITNISGNGHEVRYDTGLAANQWLVGKTVALANGGRLLPMGR